MALHSLNDGIQLLRADSLTQLAGDLTYVKHSYSIRSTSAGHWRELCKALDLLRLSGSTQFSAGFSQQLSFPTVVGFAADAVGRAPLRSVRSFDRLLYALFMWLHYISA